MNLSKKTLKALCLGLLCITFTLFEAQASAAVDEVEPVQVELVGETTSIQPGHPFWVAIPVHLEEGWHAYWKNPGDGGMPVSITWDLPEGLEVGQLLWPSPTRFTVGSTVGFGYESDFALLAEIIPSTSLQEPSIPLRGNVRWVVCSDATCLPGESSFALSLPVAKGEAELSSVAIDTFKNFRKQIPEKNISFSAERKEGHVFVSLSHPKARGTIESAEFFSEAPGTIDHNVPAQVHPQEGKNSHAIVLEELEPAQELKGVVTLHTSSGNHSYEINTPIVASGSSDVAFIDHPSKMPSIENGNSYAFEGGIALAICFAFLGGLLLNLMPCVLPVVSFKILSFIKLSGESRKLIFKHGLAFSGGVLGSFWVLAALLILLQTYGRAVGWGFQLQEPLFVAILAALIFVFGLSLFGLFEFGTSIMAKAGSVQKKSHNEFLGSFLSGILATAVASPCSGPFLGSAIGFAVTLPPIGAMSVFTSLAMGMSLPYLALAAFPSLLKFLPKPGPWMETFKHLMGFLMLASVIWLVWVFGAQAGSFSVTLLLVSFFFLAIGCWVYGRWGTLLRKKQTRTLGTLTAAAFFLVGGYTLVQSSSDWAQLVSGQTHAVASTDEVWQEYSPEKVEALKKQGVPVFVDFTAKWCLICQANHLVLSKEEVMQQFKEKGVVLMKADWTRQDQIIAEQLKKFGRNSVPLYVLYHGEEQPEILPQILTPDLVISAVQGL